MENESKSKFDWFKFLIHFTIGSVLGLFCAIPAVFLFEIESIEVGCLILVMIALCYGVLAGIRGDRFWLNINDWLWPWR
jgi:ABC-type xylose transport system permease subunit